MQKGIKTVKCFKTDWQTLVQTWKIKHLIITLSCCPTFNYCPLTWHFCGEVNTKKIKKIQERALRFIYSDYSSSYESLLIKSQLPSPKVRRIRTIALESFKILNNLSPAYLNDLLTVKNYSYNFRYQKTVEVPQVRTVKHGSSSFRSTAAKIWNSLPQHLRDISSFGVFKNQINAWSGGSCSCLFCSVGCNVFFFTC